MPQTKPKQPEPGWRLESSYTRLPSFFFSRVSPSPVREPRLILFNHPLAISLGLNAEALDTEEGAMIFAGNAIPEGSEPIAQAYAGHQFGHFTSLGDGRAVLLGEQMTPSGERVDVQLKGSGRTPYSRQGDGRATLGPMLREYLVSEAMHALGVPTTRSLAVAATGEVVLRDEELPGAVLTRVAASHVRVGTFEWAAAHGDRAALQRLADYTIARHYPDVADSSRPYVAFLDAAIERQAALIVQWLHVGFVHGVMNTDNMALSGETIDYGPCAFIDAYNPATVFSSIDRRGRYSYGNQGSIALWNLSRFAETLLPLIDTEESKAIQLASESLSTFEQRFEDHWLAGMRGKLGLFTEEAEDAALAVSLLDWMQQEQADFTNSFRSLSDPSAQRDPPFDRGAFAHWHQRWKDRLSRQQQSETEVAARMQARNPAVIPRNHKVEEALDAAVSGHDPAPLRRLLSVLKRPYEHSADMGAYTEPAAPGSRPYQTFCGT